MKRYNAKSQIGASKRKNRVPLIAVTAGDPGGIGPEIISRFFSSFQPLRSKALVLGSPEAMKPWAERYGWSCPILDSIEEMSHVEESVSFNVYILDTGCRGRVPQGRISRRGGEHAGKALELACRLAGEGAIQAIVTAPISKEALNMAGYNYSGHTEMLAKHLDSPQCQMMMVYRKFRVVPLTRHLPVASIAGQITEEGIVTCLTVVDRALKELFSLEKPKIAVTSLNPHAGEGGLLGVEEINVIRPSLRKAKRKGIRVEGPYSADSLFQSPFDGRYDAFVTMYHDQGLIPFKMAAKKRGVNVTVGLPVVRTSVDHGVAYDIAGKAEADPASLGAAYQLAEKLAKAKERRKAQPG